MKPTDLMIGDLVMFNNPIKVQHIYNNGYDDVVAEIREEGINDEGEYEEIRYVPSTYCSPIPLTPEILVKNGFSPETFLTDEWGRKVYFKEFSSCVVEPADSGKYIFGTTKYWSKTYSDGSPIDWGTMYESRIYNLQYVHELQRALRCCGLWDIADNFKV